MYLQLTPDKLQAFQRILTNVLILHFIKDEENKKEKTSKTVKQVLSKTQKRKIKRIKKIKKREELQKLSGGNNNIVQENK